MQLWPVAQVLPQAPQAFGLLSVVTHTSPHKVCPTAQRGAGVSLLLELPQLAAKNTTKDASSVWLSEVLTIIFLSMRRE